MKCHSKKDFLGHKLSFNNTPPPPIAQGRRPDPCPDGEPLREHRLLSLPPLGRPRPLRRGEELVQRPRPGPHLVQGSFGGGDDRRHEPGGGGLDQVGTEIFLKAKKFFIEKTHNGEQMLGHVQTSFFFK